MRNFFCLSDEQMARLQPFFPKSHGKPRIDDWRVLSAIILFNRNGLLWRDAPSRADWLLADRGCDADRFRDALIDMGSDAASQAVRPVAVLAQIKSFYRRCNWIEIMFGSLKEWRRLVIRLAIGARRSAFPLSPSP